MPSDMLAMPLPLALGMANFYLIQPHLKDKKKKKFHLYEAVC